MTARVAVLNVVGLSPSLLGVHTPRLRAFADRSALHRVAPMLPAVTSSVQATYLTGCTPRDHGVVANGWFNREQQEVQFWKQSDRLVERERLWDTLRRRDRSATCANLFWWHAMYSSADVTVTPRPLYPADGRKVPDVWTHPAGLRESLQRELGPFPLFHFWGPGASIASTRWIAEAAKSIHRSARPTLSLIYLPHLDYPLQKHGPGHPAIAAELAALDALVGDLIDTFERDGVRVIVLSEYGIEPVVDAVWINRELRRQGFLATRNELGREALDAGASRAFAVVDHQIAHVYVNDREALPAVRSLCEGMPGIASVLDPDAQRLAGLDHARSGELLLVAAAGRWFAYGWWLDDSRAPDYARTVDIHRKPGYDPLELLFDPSLASPKFTVGWTLFKRRLGFRALMQVVPFDTRLVGGSHGRIPEDESVHPVFISSRRHADGALPATGVRDAILAELE